MSFSPDDLKKKYPGKYDDWKFVKNAKDEWYGSNKKEYGIIVSKKDKDGNEYPEVEIRKTETMGPGLGAVPFVMGGMIKRHYKKKGKGLAGWIKFALIAFVIVFFYLFFLI